jgi:hypothetical protein
LGKKILDKKRFTFATIAMASKSVMMEQLHEQEEVDALASGECMIEALSRLQVLASKDHDAALQSQTELLHMTAAELAEYFEQITYVHVL